MKQNTVNIVAVVFALVISAMAAETPALTNQNARMSYTVGVDLARNFRRQGVEIDMALLVKGLQDGYAGEKLLLSENDFRQLLTTTQNELRLKQRLAGRTAAEINRNRGEAFRASNKTKDGVVTLPSGLQYRILTAGTGRTPAGTDIVECNYRGTLLDGTGIIGTNPGQPATFKVQEAAIAAWAEALPLMPAGSKWQLFAPPQLAYGAQGVGHDVGPNETLIFELELVAVK